MIHARRSHQSCTTCSSKEPAMTRKPHVLLLAHGARHAARADAAMLARKASSRSRSRAGVLSLNAQASAEVPQDVVDITLFYEQEASDPSALTTHAESARRRGAAPGQGRERRDGAHAVRSRSIRPPIAMAAFPHGAAARKSCWSRMISRRHRSLRARWRRSCKSATCSSRCRRKRSAPPSRSSPARRSIRSASRRSVRAQAFGYSGYSIREVNVGHNGVDAASGHDDERTRDGRRREDGRADAA